MLSRRLLCLSARTEAHAVQREWLRSGKCIRCFHASVWNRAEEDGGKQSNDQGTPYNAPKRGPTRHQRAAMASEEVRMLARDTPSLGPSKPQSRSQGLEAHPQPTGEEGRTGTMGENMPPEREGLLGQGMGRPVRSQDDDLGEASQVREVRTPQSAIEEPTRGGAGLIENSDASDSIERRTRQEEEEEGEEEGGEEDESEGPPDLVTRQQRSQDAKPIHRVIPAPGISYLPDGVSRDHFLYERPSPSTIAASNFEGVVNTRLRTAVEPGQDLGVRNSYSLARKFLNGKFMRFKTSEEKEAVMDIAQKMNYYWVKIADQEKVARETKEPNGGQTRERVERPLPYFLTLSEALRKKILDRVVRGVYDADGTLDGKPKHKQPVLTEIAKMTMKNGTYLNTDGDRFLRKVQSLLPAAQTQASQQQKGNGQQKQKQK